MTDEIRIDTKIFKLWKSEGCLWARLFGFKFLHMLHDSHEPLYSERYGGRKYFHIPLTKWRIQYYG